jgi:hypothetical protein
MMTALVMALGRRGRSNRSHARLEVDGLDAGRPLSRRQALAQREAPVPVVARVEHQADAIVLKLSRQRDRLARRGSGQDLGEPRLEAHGLVV